MAARDLVNLSLDDIISMNNKFKRSGNLRGRGRGRGARGAGGFSRGTFRARQIPTIVNTVQRKYSRPGGQRMVDEKLCTVHISNLGPMVSTRDLQELFAEHPCIDIAVHHDQYGKSRGTAVVLFRRFDEAMQLKREFTGVKLDGRMMELFAVSNAPSSRTGRTMQPTSNFGISRGRVAKFGNRRSSGFTPRKSLDNNNFGGFRVPKSTRGRGASSSKRPQMSAEELDRELDAYMHSSKHTRIIAP